MPFRCVGQLAIFLYRVCVSARLVERCVQLISCKMGGDHGHGHHTPTYKVPDWRIYKVESSPELMEVKRLLAQKGLKDPWLRNEVWRYDRTMFPSPSQNLKRVFFRGFWPGLALAVLTVTVETLWEKAYPSEHGHH